MANYKVFCDNAYNFKTLIYGESSGNPVAVSADSNGYVYVKSLGLNNAVVNVPTTAFGEVRTAALTPRAGWTFSYNINTDLVTTTTSGSGSISQSNSKAVLQTGTSASSASTLHTRESMRYVAGIGGLVRFTAVFTSGVSGNTQIIGLGDESDGFFFGYNGTSFGILRRSNGVDNWTYQSNWNHDKLDGTGSSSMTLDKTKGNIYSIRYQWLGFGTISYYVSNPATGDDILVHTIEYANHYTNPSVYNPTFPVYARVHNTTNTTNVQLQSPSAMAFQEGYPYNVNTTRNAAYGSKASIITEVAVLSIRNKSTYQSKTNRTVVKLDFASQSTEGTKPVNFRLVRNATLGGTPAWTDISANTSVVQYDTAGTTVSGGATLFRYTLAKSDSVQLYLNDLQLDMLPGESFTIAATSSVAAEVNVSLTWLEYF